MRGPIYGRVQGVCVSFVIVVTKVRLERAVPYVLKLLTESQQHDAIERACTIKVTSGLSHVLYTRQRVCYLSLFLCRL